MTIFECSSEEGITRKKTVIPKEAREKNRRSEEAQLKRVCHSEGGTTEDLKV